MLLDTRLTKAFVYLSVKRMFSQSKSQESVAENTFYVSS